MTFASVRLQIAVVLGMYIAEMSLTAAAQQGDTVYYAESVAARFHGRDVAFRDFGHLLWRPLGYLVLRTASPFTTWPSDTALALAATKLLIALGLLSGAVAVMAFASWLSRLSLSNEAVVAGTLALMLTHGFTNYAHTGSSYIPALAM